LGPVAYKQPLLYNLAVTREVIKQIYIREGLQPPNLSTVRSAYSSLWSEITTPGLVRNLIQDAEVGRLCVYGLQAYGIFKVRFISCFVQHCTRSIKINLQIGEVLGRRSLIGYDLH
jgi:F-type H+-transporting ATPase subunit g